MSRKPPDNLMEWSKGDLAKEVRRLRAVLSEHAEHHNTTDPSKHHRDGRVIDVAQDPNAAGGVLLDVRGAVLLDTVDVSLIDSKREGGAPIAFLGLAGRVNMSEERAEHAYMFGPDGAAGLVAELVGLAERSLVHDNTMLYGVAFAEDFNRRREQLP